MPNATGVAMTGNPDIDGVLSGIKWATTSLSFSFPTSMSFYGYSLSGFEAFNAAQQAAAEAALSQYSSVSGLVFTEVTESASVHGDIRFAEEDNAGTAYAYYPSPSEFGGDAWFNHSNFNNPLKGTYAFSTVMHELGHAMGLKHGHEGLPPLPYDHDSNEYSVMTYRSYVGSPGNYYTIASGSGPQTLMLSDIAALQTMYGANYGHNAGDTVYTWSPSTGEAFVNGVGQGASTANKIFMTVWDGGGTDTYDFSSYTTDLSVDLRPGEWTTTSDAQLARLGYDAGLGGTQWARGNIANAWLFEDNPASLIENAIGGSGDDTIVGNEADNRLQGGAGNDTLVGGDGNDTVSFADATSGLMFDLRSHDGSMYVPVGGGLGSDRLDSIEDIVGGDFADLLIGDGAGNEIVGGPGHDLIFGVGGQDTLLGGGGIDYLVGGSGVDFLDGQTDADAYVADTDNDVFSDSGSEVNDLLHYDNFSFGVTVDLAITSAQNVGDGVMHTISGIEYVTATIYNDQLYGDTNDNFLLARDGDDHLEGRGGNDALFGEAGNDMLLGQDGIDFLVGGEGNDTLDGGADPDALYGQQGDDLYYVDSLQDLVFEFAGEGTDTVNSTVGHYMFQYVEILQLAAGAGDLFGVGNELDNRIYGNEGANMLSGGAGSDTIEGGAGNDTQYGQAGADTFVFTEDWGFDTIGDFENGLDILDFTGLATAGVHAFPDLTVASLETYTTITFGEDVITFTGFTDTFDYADWLFA